MTRVVVVGGSGRTGRLIVEQLIKKADSVVATIRNPKQMAPLVKVGNTPNEIAVPLRASAWVAASLTCVPSTTMT